MNTHQNRTLGAFEKTFWLLDQIDSKDFALAGEIEGKLPVEIWQQAINKVQQRHPNLSVRIVLDQFSRPVLEHVAHMPITVRVINADDDYRWEAEVEKELAERFDTAKGPLLRPVLIQKPESTVLILAGHHAIADGTSISYLFRDILAAATGQELKPMEPQKANDETLGLQEDVAHTSSETIPSLPNNFKAVAPKVSSIRLDEQLTRLIIETAKEEQTTVHGALCAAVLIASRTLRSEWADKKIEMISPICSRRALQLDDNYGLNITTHAVYFEEEQALSFWDVARLAKAGLEGTNSVEHVKNYINFFRGLTFNSTDIPQMIATLKEAFNHELMVTNLGTIKYGTDFGELKLIALYGPMVRSGKGKEQTVGAITSNGSLCLTSTSDDPIDRLLNLMVRILVEACPKG